MSILSNFLALNSTSSDYPTPAKDVANVLNFLGSSSAIECSAFVAGFMLMEDFKNSAANSVPQILAACVSGVTASIGASVVSNLIPRKYRFLSTLSSASLAYYLHLRMKKSKPSS